MDPEKASTNNRKLYLKYYLITYLLMSRSCEVNTIIQAVWYNQRRMRWRPTYYMTLPRKQNCYKIIQFNPKNLCWKCPSNSVFKVFRTMSSLLQFLTVKSKDCLYLKLLDPFNILVHLQSSTLLKSRNNPIEISVRLSDAAPCNIWKKCPFSQK